MLRGRPRSAAPQDWRAAARELFVDWTALITHRLAPQLENSPLQVRAADARAKLEQYFRALIAERRLNLGNDLLSTLIRAEEAGDRLSSEELIVQALGLLVAGFETRLGLIGNGVRQLLLHPDQLAKLREQPALIGPAVEECLRFDGPIQGTRRVLHEDAEFAGQLLPKNSVMFASFGAAHRDPRAFQDPDRFLIEREPNPHLAFGGGPHFCLGVHLARLEAQIAISTVCRRFPNLALDSDKIFWGESLFRIQSRMPVRLY